MGVEITTREQLKDLVKSLINEIADEAVELATGPSVEVDNGVTVDDFFSNVADVVELAALGLKDSDDIISVSTSYDILDLVLGYCSNQGWIGSYDEWADVLGHFRQRSDEFAGMGGVSVASFDIPPEKLTRVTDKIVTKWVRDMDGYMQDGVFSDADKIELVRSTLISLRNSGYLKYDPWLKRLLALLREDWKIFGGGFSSDMGTGPNPWSAG